MKSLRHSVNVQTYVFPCNGGRPVKAYMSALHLRDDFRIRTEHRLSPSADSLGNSDQILLFLVIDFNINCKFITLKEESQQQIQKTLKS